jgi:hypothetical protein
MQPIKDSEALGGKKVLIAVAAVLVVGVVISLFVLNGNDEKKLELVPKEKVVEENMAAETEVGTGWSAKESPADAVHEALGMALEGKMDKTPDFAIIFASSGSDLDAILAEAKETLGNGTKIYGGTSDSRAVMTDKGFVKATEHGYEQSLMEGKRALAVMTVSSQEVTFGVGSADASAFSSAQEAAKAAVADAIMSAGRPAGELPEVILLTPTYKIEEDVLEGVEQVVGKSTPIIGGSTGGPEFGVFGRDAAYKEGVSLAIIYTDLPVGWAFEGGFDVTDPHSGIVTKVDGQDLVEIDNRPALDVYDEWLGGKIEELHRDIGKPDEIRDLLTLHPLYRKYTSAEGRTYFLFSHPWPKDDSLKNRSVSTSTRIKVGERVYLSHGTWETLLNRIGNLPRDAKVNADISVDARPILSIGYICGGVMGTIPETEREKMPLLINYADRNAPFIAPFTWGEQGQLPGVGNRHGNLLTPFIIIGPKEKAK